MQQPAVLRALQELKVLTQAQEERERYEARRKAQLDHNTWLKVARMEGEKIGMIHLIHHCERLLQRSHTPTERLAGLSLEEVTRIAEGLQEQLAHRP